MTSVQSAIAQVPRYANTLVALVNPTPVYTAVNTSPSTGALISQVGSSYNFNAATTISAANILTAGTSVTTVGAQLRDLGGKIHIFSNGELALTLSLVQVLNNFTTEGVSGS